MTNPAPANARSLAEVIKDSQKWFSDTLLSLFYNDLNEIPASSLPKEYAEWSKHSQTQNSFRLNALEKLRQEAERMNSALQEAKKVSPPDPSDFEKFIRAYETFSTALNDIQCEFLLNSKGVDVQTGFKSQFLVLPEMKREFERRGRQGNPFSVVMLRMETGDGAEENEGRMRIMAKAINQCLRGFDDVYRMNDTDVLVSLKLSDIKGGLRFTERVKAELKTLNAHFTFASCVAEPDPSSELTKFLKDLEDDLASAAAHGGGQTVKFEEISPMQRFIAAMKDKH